MVSIMKNAVGISSFGKEIVFRQAFWTVIVRRIVYAEARIRGAEMSQFTEELDEICKKRLHSDAKHSMMQIFFAL